MSLLHSALLVVVFALALSVILAIGGRIDGLRDDARERGEGQS